MVSFFMFMILCGLLSFSINRKHFILMLISLEFVVVLIYLLIFYNLSFLGEDKFFCMLFLTLSVCEGVLGLSVLVSLIRSHGNDYFNSFNVLW